MLAGKWTYRSYHNETALIGDDPQAALALIFGEGIFDFREAGPGRFTGALGLGSDYALTLEAEVTPAEGEAPARFAIAGKGIDGTPTAGWQYDYNGVFGYLWPSGVDQPATLLGTVLRAVAHGPGAPAGVTAGFIAVRQPDDPPSRSQRAFPLTAGL